MFWFYRNIKYFIIIALVIFFFIFILMIKPDTTTEHMDLRKKPVENLQTKKIKFNSCMKEAAKIHYNNTDRFFGEFSVCIKSIIGIDETRMDFFNNQVNNEKKVFLPMSSEYRKSECKWLTIGIGGSTAAEELVAEKYPNCLIYGVDPTNAGNFSKVGKLLPFGVGLEDNKITLSVDINSIYEKRTETVMSLTRMLDEFVHSRLVHYLAIDIEGLEMIILAELVGFGKLSNENITFCQIDIEMHSPTQESATPLAKDINRVQWMLDFLSESSPYLPVYTIPYIPAHKVTFVNVVNPECQKAFKISSYFV